MTGLTERKEKKVEYIELVYDLIFVYVIGRNNALLHHIVGGFVDPLDFYAYVLCTLAVIQIWNFTTYYVNVYGRNGVRDHVFLFVNMFLMYFIGEGTRSDWQAYHTQYHIAWALILVNVAAQYLIELRNQADKPENQRQIRRMAAILLIEAALAAAACLEFNARQSSHLSLAAILFGMCATVAFGQRSSGSFVDFPHLTERVMLYVVFTFGEMIISLSSYFEGVLTASSFYYSLMGFLIVAGLFLTYGVFYDRIVDREKESNGLGYMLAHIFIIFALNDITNSLEFMQEAEVALLPKILFLTVSFLTYFAFLLLAAATHSKCGSPLPGRFYWTMLGLGAAFFAVMLLLRENSAANIALSVVFVFAVFGVFYRYGKAVDGIPAE